MTVVAFLYVTHPDADEAQRLAQALVEAEMAAAVNILPRSQTVYRWKGAVETGSETVMIVKTRASLVDAVTEFIREKHPYECPGIAALPIAGGNPAYLDWVAEVTGPARPDFDGA